MPFTGAEQCLNFKTPDARHAYIFDEIQWFLRSYNPFPQFMISYNRTAFRGRENGALRITFDSDIRCETAGLDFSSLLPGIPLLDSDARLMEIKVDTAIPLSLSAHLSGLNIVPVSFSKYRKAYEILLNENLLNNQGLRYA
jgi:hypothetical protein